MEIKNAAIEEITCDPSHDGKSFIPDFTGRTMGEVVRIARERNIDVRLSGTGWAVKQNPAPGAFCDDKTVCAVLFRPAY